MKHFLLYPLTALITCAVIAPRPARSEIYTLPQAIAPMIPPFYSDAGREHNVEFNSRYVTEETRLNFFLEMSDSKKREYVERRILPLFKFLFGPLTHRSEGSPQKGDHVTVNWEEAQLIAGKVSLPYRYQGVWLLRSDIATTPSFQVPMPLNAALVLTPRWKACTDAAPEHQTMSFYWYYWDPARYGCDQTEGTQYSTVIVRIGAGTLNQPRTFPEYEKLVRSAGQAENFQLTYGFGYVEDVPSPNPESDQDAGAAEYRKFVKTVRSFQGGIFQETPITEGEYLSASHPNRKIGHRFTGIIQGVKVTVNVIAAAGIDQMEIFAKSFAHDHDGFFAWLGHSRVGSGFDSDHFMEIVAERPDYYQMTPDYQLVYWGGCNSYSYYTLPFFAAKARIAGSSDPKGTRGLDLIANGLPSYFSLNAINAKITLLHLLNWPARPSYQLIVGDLEKAASSQGIEVLVAVLGDEDNPSTP